MKILIFGITGQDGSYLSRLMLEEGHKVYGAARNMAPPDCANLEALQIYGKVDLLRVSVEDYSGVLEAVGSIRPDEIYNLAGQSSVGLSFKKPYSAAESNFTGVLNILEAIRMTERGIRFFNAGSTECFGNTGETPAVETAPLHPTSPYAAAKAAAQFMIASYREAYGMFACTGILSNHESPLRPTSFVTRKIVKGAVSIARGEQEKLALGNMSIIRDWGWAPEFVEAFRLILGQDEPEDFILATGESNSLEGFVSYAFSLAGLNWRDHVVFDPELSRPSDTPVCRVSPDKAAGKLNWQAKYRMRDVVKMLFDAESGPVIEKERGARS